MTDRELLELAAKAIGLQVKGWVGDKLMYWDPIREHAGFGDWNPLTNDGDAFRLALRLNLVVRPCALDGTAECRRLYETHHHGEVMSIEAAARRLITRAAAEIGQGMDHHESQELAT